MEQALRLKLTGPSSLPVKGLLRLRKEGLTPMEALQAGTRNCADSLGRLKELGTIEEGKFADLIVLDADPLKNINNTTRISAVIANGRLFQRANLDGILKDVAEKAPTR